MGQLLEESLAYTRVLIEELTPSGLRTGELMPAVHAMAFEMRQRGCQVYVGGDPWNITLSEPITAFLYRGVYRFLRQAMGDGISSLITVSIEGEQVSILRVNVAIDRTAGAKAPMVHGQEQTLEMVSASIQVCAKLLGIAVRVESLPGTTTALVLDVPLPGSSHSL